MIRNKVLGLTTPHMRGPAVLKLQKALKSNKYGKFYTGDLDSDFGPLTAQAVHRAKYWLGYAKRDINQHAGSLLMSLLLGVKPLPAANVLRRKARQRATKQIALRVKAFNLAKQQLGIGERPSNHNKFTEWYGFDGAWCVMFVSWCYAHVGSKTFRPLGPYCNTDVLLGDARSGRNNLSLTKDPKMGDLVLIDWSGGSDPDHIEMFSHRIDSGRFATIGGNVGNAVRSNTRYYSNVVAFVHVGK